MVRPSRIELYMGMARLVATRGTCLRKRVGVVIVRDHRIVSMGYNGAPPGMPHCLDVGCGGEYEEIIPDAGGSKVLTRKKIFPNGCTRAIHAETNAIVFSARQGIPTDNAEMYSTCATCATCAALVVASGIRSFTFEEPYRLTQGLDLLIEAGVEVTQWNQ